MKKFIKIVALSCSILFSLLCAFLYLYYLYWNYLSPPFIPLGFDQTNCVRPCWYGLQAGVSRKEDVQRKLLDLSKILTDFEFTESENYKKREYSIYIKFQDPSIDTPQVFWMSFKEDQNDDFLDYIDFGRRITLSKVFELFGEPDIAIAYSYSVQSPTNNRKDLDFFYIEKGIYVGCYDKSGLVFKSPEKYSCSKRDNIRLIFFDPILYEELLALFYGDVDTALQYIRPYQGLNAEYPILEQK